MRQFSSSANSERGYYTIALVVVIAFVALLASRSGTVTTSNTVKTTSEEVVAAEAFYAAEFALAEALIWLGSNDATATPQTGAGVPNDSGNNTPRSYATSFWFEESGDYTRVYARAAGTDGSSATITQWLSTGNDVLASTALEQPLGIAGTLSNVTGTPEINVIGSDGVLPTDHYSMRVASGETPTSYGNLNNSSGEVITTGEWSSGVTDIWSLYFSVDRATMESLASDTGNIRWYEPGEGPSTSLGTTSSPVILIFEECTRITGQKRIIGVVFIDDNSGCDLNGWSMDLKGSLGVNGDVTKLNSNTDLEAYYITEADSIIMTGSGPSATGIDNFDPEAFASTVVLPGTWTDTEVN
jgi:hypothetical protein